MTFQAYGTSRYLPAGLFRAKIKNSFPSIFFVDRWRAYSSFPSFTEPSNLQSHFYMRSAFPSTILLFHISLSRASPLFHLFSFDLIYDAFFIFGYISESDRKVLYFVFQFCTKRSLETGKVETPHTKMPLIWSLT